MKEAIVDKVNVSLLKQELSSEIYVRPTNKGEKEIYIFNGLYKPHLMREVGRLRELSFRMPGGGTGKSMDVDELDTQENGYKQLIVWDPLEEQIVGGYRFVFCKDRRNSQGNYDLSTSEILTYSEDIKTKYFPYTIELGRSFVQPDYQPSINGRKGIFSLDNLWDGLGALVADNPEMKYFFGKITMYNSFNQEAKGLIYSFMHAVFPDNENLVQSVNPLTNSNENLAFLKEIEGLPYKKAFNLLSKNVRELGEQVPPLFNSYMSLSPTMKTFGTSINHHFGGVEETGIMVTINDIYEEKKSRHVNSYIDWKNSKG